MSTVSCLKLVDLDPFNPFIINGYAGWPWPGLQLTRVKWVRPDYNPNQIMVNPNPLCSCRLGVMLTGHVRNCHPYIQATWYYLSFHRALKELLILSNVLASTHAFVGWYGNIRGDGWICFIIFTKKLKEWHHI